MAHRPAECRLDSVYKARPLEGLCSDAPNDCSGCFYYGLLQHGARPFDPKPQPMIVTIYLIAGPIEDGLQKWWRGTSPYWDTIDEAMVFTPDERHIIDLPEGGRWIRFKDAP